MINIHGMKNSGLLCLILIMALLTGSISSATLTYDGEAETASEVEASSEPEVSIEPSAEPVENGEVETAGEAEVSLEPEEPVEPSAEPVENGEAETVNEAEVSSEPEESAEPSAEPDAEETSEAVVYANSISGMVWIDTNDDGIRDNDELPLAGFTVGLYEESDPAEAVRTATTDADGMYRFTNIEPVTYMVGVKATFIDGDEYLTPLVGVTGDNKFHAADALTDYIISFSDPIGMAEDSVITDIDAGIRTPPGVAPRANGVICSYYGRYVSAEGYPIANAQVRIAFCYQTQPLIGSKSYRYDMANTVTNSNGDIIFFSKLSYNDVTVDPIYFVLLFPKSSFGGVSQVQIRNQASKITSNANASPYAPQTIASKFNITPYGLSTSDYDAFAVGSGTVNSWWGNSQEIHIGGYNPNSTPPASYTPQEISIGLSSTVQTKITENYYIEGTPQTLFDSNTKVYITNVNYSNNPNDPRTITVGGVTDTYEYAGYRLNTTSGALQTGRPITMTVQRGSSVTFNYYYRLPAGPKTVQIKYMDLNGVDLAIQPDSSSVSVANGNPFSHNTEQKNVGYYKAVYYTLSTDIPIVTYPVPTTSPRTVSIASVTEDVTVTIYFVSTLIDIEVPARMEFYATAGTGGVVTPDAAGTPNYATATFNNVSDLPVQVLFEKMTVDTINTSNALSIVEDVDDIAVSSINRRLHLDIVPTSGITNDFTTGISNIRPDTAYTIPVLMGTLDGKYYTESDIPAGGQVSGQGSTVGTGGSGTCEVGGKYVGDYPLVSLKYNVNVIFTFTLELMGY